MIALSRRLVPYCFYHLSNRLQIVFVTRRAGIWAGFHFLAREEAPVTSIPGFAEERQVKNIITPAERTAPLL